jgi:hypothetical protein
MCALAGAVVLTLTGCSGDNAFCSANPVLAYVFCRADTNSSSTPPGYTIPSTPAAPPLPPTVQIGVSTSSPRRDQPVTFTGTWSDSDGHVTKYEWDLDGNGQYEISGTPNASNRDQRSRAYSEFRTVTVRLRVTDDDGYVGSTQALVTVQPVRPTAVLVVTPAAPRVGETVTFDASQSTSPDTPINGYVWDIDGNVANGYELRTDGPTTTRTYATAGTIEVGVRALDAYAAGHFGQARQTLAIGSGPRSLAAAAAPAAARPFSASLNAKPVPGRPGRYLVRGTVQSLKGTLAKGSFNGRLTKPATAAERLLSTLLHAGYTARIDASLNLRTRKTSSTMLALATFKHGSACLEISLANGKGSFRVLGGTGQASRLAATGTFRATQVRLTGTAKAHLVAARGFPRACASLR